MANLATLKAALNAAIYQNNQNAITGESLNTILTKIIDTLGAGYRYAGVATPSANPGTIDNRVFYLATAAGTYTNFGAAVLNGKKLHIFIYDTAWHDIALDVPTTAALAVLQGSGTNSVLGKDPAANATGNGSVCLGSTSGDGGELSANGRGSIVVGSVETHDGDQSVAEIVANGEGSFAGGYAYGEEGSTARIISNSSGAHAEGRVDASANDSIIDARGAGSHAEGYALGGSIISEGDGSHAEGYASDEENIQATGVGSHAEGCTSANGPISASGDGAHAEGSGTTASGECSHAEGTDNTAGGYSSHAEGQHNTTQNLAEHAEGNYNLSHKKTTGTAAEQAAGSTLSSVGCGTGSNDRKNAVEVMRNGDLYVKNLGGYDGTNPDEALCIMPKIIAMQDGDVTESEFRDNVPAHTADDVAILSQMPFVKATNLSGNEFDGIFMQLPLSLYPAIENLESKIDEFCNLYPSLGFTKIAAIFVNSIDEEISVNNPSFLEVLYFVVLYSDAYHCYYYIVI